MCVYVHTCVCIIYTRTHMSSSTTPLLYRIAISELLSSKPLRELLAVADLDYEHMTAPPDNWFAVHSLLALKGGFAELDKDGDGLLSLEEFAGYVCTPHNCTPPYTIYNTIHTIYYTLYTTHHTLYTPYTIHYTLQYTYIQYTPYTPHPKQRLSMGTMSKLFVQRVFERFCRSTQGKLVMDMHGFVDFMLAWDGRATVQGMAVLFPVFDLDNKGYLNEVCVCVEVFVLVERMSCVCHANHANHHSQTHRLICIHSCGKFTSCGFHLDRRPTCS